jgi:NRAMP (natural resistance-associated macrophage protein)-like metal ion transporter
MKKLKLWFKKLGPGLITGASDDDPSGIATYSQAGAGFGLNLLWTALITYPLMFCVQEMCARIGLVTGKGLAGIVKKHYTKYSAYLLILLIFPAVTFNIAADLAGMAAVANLLFPLIPPIIFCLAFTVLLICSLIFFSYSKMAHLLKWFCLSLLVYLVVPFLVQKNWEEVIISTFLPQIEWNTGYLTILVAILGTTISPYLFFWQTSMSIEEKNHTADKSPHHEIKDMKIDVNIGMFLSNLVMFFIILTTASVLFPAGIHTIHTVEEAAIALKPLAGKSAYLLFALGVIGTGLLAIPVLAGCLGYIFADVLNWNKGLDRKAREAPGFYAVITSAIFIGFLMNIYQLDPIQSLIYTAILYGLTAPFLIAIILHICNSKAIMGNFVNKTLTNVIGFFTLFLMTFAGLAYFFVG